MKFIILVKSFIIIVIKILFDFIKIYVQQFYKYHVFVILNNSYFLLSLWTVTRIIFFYT